MNLKKRGAVLAILLGLLVGLAAKADDDYQFLTDLLSQDPGHWGSWIETTRPCGAYGTIGEDPFMFITSGFVGEDTYTIAGIDLVPGQRPENLWIDRKSRNFGFKMLDETEVQLAYTESPPEITAFVWKRPGGLYLKCQFR